MISMRYWLPANSVILWLCRTAGLEHPQHAVGDEKSANYVARRSDDGNHPQNGRECALLFADQDNRTDDRDGIEGIRQRHEWRMQQRRNVADNFESDESRQHEYEKCIDQVGTHVLTPVLCSRFSVLSYVVILSGVAAPRSGAAAESKDPVHSCAVARSEQGVLPAAKSAARTLSPLRMTVL